MGSAPGKSGSSDPVPSTTPHPPVGALQDAAIRIASTSPASAALTYQVSGRCGDAMKSEFIDNGAGCANTVPMTTDNTIIVQRALAGLLETGDVDTLAPLLTHDFVHHRPGSTTSTKAQWLAAVQAALVPLAGMQVEIQQLLADGDRVVMYSRRWLPGGGPEIAVVDIWRIDGGLIAEAWEIIEPVAQVAANLRWWEPAGH